MPVISGRALDYDQTGALLDVPVLVVDEFDGSPDRLAYLNPDHAAAAGVDANSLTPQTIWTLLRELAPGAGLRIDPGSADELRFADDEVDAVLGVTDRATASTLSRRRRADLGSAWVLFRRLADGTLEPSGTDSEGRSLSFCWRDEAAARGSLHEGESLVQFPLAQLLGDNPELIVVVDPGLPEGVFIDAKLRGELLATLDFFPRGYLASVGELAAPLANTWAPALASMAKRVRETGVPLGGLWAVGYRLERAPDQILIVADVEEQRWAEVVAALEAGLAEHPVDGRTVSSLRLDDIPPAFQPIVAASRNAA